MREPNAVIAIVDALSMREGPKQMVDKGKFQSKT